MSNCRSLKVRGSTFCPPVVTAIEYGIPIVGVTITSSMAYPYDFSVANAFMTHLDMVLDESTREKLVALGVDVADAAFKLSNTLPNIISLPLNSPSAGLDLSTSLLLPGCLLPVLACQIRGRRLETRGRSEREPRHPCGARLRNRRRNGKSGVARAAR